MGESRGDEDEKKTSGNVKIDLRIAYNVSNVFTVDIPLMCELYAVTFAHIRERDEEIFAGRLMD